ncbi:hypothetical protein CPB85DRAFT_1552209 [Mucidula mucida]|nr:hypothetical protein CPB85DRAFT_1552209 [Mucidula mucida]
MPRSSRPPCQICSTNESKYTCSGCLVVYCSVPCYKDHKANSCGAAARPSENSHPPPLVDEAAQPTSKEELLEDPKPLRALSSLKWPYVPEASAYPDPLERDDPKPLQLRQYEAIAMSPKLRQVIAEHPNLPALLTSIDKLRGHEREQALYKALNVTDPEIVDKSRVVQLEEDVLALRALAEAVEEAVRGDKKNALGLDWGDD